MPMFETNHLARDDYLGKFTDVYLLPFFLSVFKEPCVL